MYAMYRGSLAPKRFFRKLALVLKGVEWVGLVLQQEKFELLNEGIVGVIPDRVHYRKRISFWQMGEMGEMAQKHYAVIWVGKLSGGDYPVIVATAQTKPTKIQCSELTGVESSIFEPPYRCSELDGDMLPFESQKPLQLQEQYEYWYKHS
ncbi:hypothetical protein BD777DRAFT_154990, partial [Yarrowia lipolytica]